MVDVVVWWHELRDMGAGKVFVAFFFFYGAKVFFL
jgi:hypothetical protein